MKKLLFVLMTVLMIPAIAFCAGDKKDAPAKPAETAKKGGPDVPKMSPASGAAATSAAPSEAEIAEMRVLKACFLKCREKIGNGIIEKAEGMTCLDLCLDDSLSGAASAGTVKGRVYLKLANGNIEKGLKLRIAFLRIDVDPKDKPENLKAIREDMVKLVNTPINEKKPSVCSSPDKFKDCGYGKEKDMSMFIAGALATDIDNGAFTANGLPEGTYVIWLDWFMPNGDGTTGTLYRWLRPVVVSKGKTVNMDLSEENISYILPSFPRSYFVN